MRWSSLETKCSYDVTLGAREYLFAAPSCQYLIYFAKIIECRSIWNHVCLVGSLVLFVDSLVIWRCIFGLYSRGALICLLFKKSNVFMCFFGRKSKYQYGLFRSPDKFPNSLFTFNSCLRLLWLAFYRLERFSLNFCTS